MQALINGIASSGYTSDVYSSCFKDDNEELRREMQKIELQYQKAMKEISGRRHEAIHEATKRLSQKNVQSLVECVNFFSSFFQYLLSLDAFFWRTQFL